MCNDYIKLLRIRGANEGGYNPAAGEILRRVDVAIRQHKRECPDCQPVYLKSNYNFVQTPTRRSHTKAQEVTA